MNKAAFVQDCSYRLAFPDWCLNIGLMGALWWWVGWSLFMLYVWVGYKSYSHRHHVCLFLLIFGFTNQIKLFFLYPPGISIVGLKISKCYSRENWVESTHTIYTPSMKKVILVNIMFTKNPEEDNPISAKWGK